MIGRFFKDIYVSRASGKGPVRTKKAVSAYRRSALLLALTLLFSILSYSVFALRNENAEDLFRAILDFRVEESGARSVQDWIDEVLPQKAGTGGEWAVIALSQTGGYDLHAYGEALSLYLSKNSVASASSRQKYALALCASGKKDDEFVSRTMNDSIGKLGVMSLIFGLHLLNNGLGSDTHTSEDVIDSLLASQHEDGGWSVTGSYGDVDVTAMALSALAPRRELEKVRTAAETGLLFLSGRQTDDGDFSSFGVRNANSCAQVLTALSDLGIDERTDGRFIKNGNTVLDGLLRYRLPDGSFSYKEDAVYNNMATEQAFYALAALMRMQKGKGPLFVLDAVSGPFDPPEPPTSGEIPTSPASPTGDDRPTPQTDERDPDVPHPPTDGASGRHDPKDEPRPGDKPHGAPEDPPQNGAPVFPIILGSAAAAVIVTALILLIVKTVKKKKGKA